MTQFHAASRDALAASEQKLLDVLGPNEGAVKSRVKKAVGAGAPSADLMCVVLV